MTYDPFRASTPSRRRRARRSSRSGGTLACHTAAVRAVRAEGARPVAGVRPWRAIASCAIAASLAWLADVLPEDGVPIVAATAALAGAITLSAALVPARADEPDDRARP